MGYEKSVVASVSHYRLDRETDMEVQIHQLEQDAYSAVLRAFKAQSDALTWVCIFSYFLYVFYIIFILVLF